MNKKTEVLKINNWITWNGSECPVDGETLVDVIINKVQTWAGEKAKDLYWGEGTNIIAYRIREAEEK